MVEEINFDSESYSTLIKSIKKCNFPPELYGKSINESKFPDLFITALDETILREKVRSIVIEKAEDCNQINVEFILSEIHLEYIPCPDSFFPLPDSQVQIGNIEIIGINNNWSI